MMDFDLLPFQIAVGKAILSGKNVILQAPPGAGKTYAALKPFFNALENSRLFPKKCLYAVPMRVLANQFVSAYGDFLKSPTIRLTNQRSSRDPLVDIQTGEQRRDPRLEAALTFVTIDQLLSSFLGAPFSLPRRLANLNAGAVLSSYLVLDEFHLYDPESTLPTALEMLRIVNGVCPFILMTATFSTPLLNDLAKELNATVIGGTPEDHAAFAALPSQQKTRRYHPLDEPLSAERVLATHKRRSIVLCNQVERAQAMAHLINQSAPDEVRVILLHSRFLAEDRRRIEGDIRRHFGKPADAETDSSGSVILVATQVIEVGLDITSETLHTELAPANAIIQRAGRCARYQGEVGDVYIYRWALDPDEGEIDLSEKVNPYAEHKEVIRQTWEAFAARNGVLDYAGELAVINHAHGKQDAQISGQLKAKGLPHRERMFDVMVGGDYEKAPTLIREMFQQRVVIHDDPKALLERLRAKRLSPYSLDGFGLHIGIAAGYVKTWLAQNLADEPEYRVAMLVSQPDPDQANRTEYTVTMVSGSQEFAGAAILFVHPDLAGYDPERGFLPNEGRPFERPAEPPLGENTNKPDDPYGYRLETYEAHIERVYREFESPVWIEAAYAAAQIEAKYHLPKGQIQTMAKLAVILHDTGKLNVKWQAWVKAWQTFIGLTDEYEQGAAYAHTDNYTAEHRRLDREFRTAKHASRPPHAVEGAAAALYILTEAVGDDETLLEVLFTVIARHHSPDAESLREPFDLEQGATRRTAGLLETYLPDLPNLRKAVRFPTKKEQKGIEKDFITQEWRELPYMLTMLLSRVLRRADQRGTQVGIVKEG